MSPKVVTSAGRARELPANPRREAIKLIRTALRKADATDGEVDAALEALVELAQDRGN